MTPLQDNTRQNNFKSAYSLDKVAQFHRTFDLPVKSTPCIPDKSRCALRISLLEEELEELKEAISQSDLVAAADAFCDLQYVLSGAILEFGMGKVFSEMFNEVQRSNMSKVCVDQAEADETAAYYKEHHSMESVIKQSAADQFLVYRKSDGKVLKSVNYSPANLIDILNK